jgi:MoCo/4Fe-4S cofactor protein with predicted Tat translocation signal
MSKRILDHPEVPADETTVAWRGVGQLEDTAGFREWLEREFPRGAAELANEGECETSRRSFLKLMGASTALAGFGMAACRRPEAYIVPYANAPEWVIPGKATYYATTMPRPFGATPLVVTSFEGRPTKLAPNHLHPDADGTDAFVQASILDLYSPYRSTQVLQGGTPSNRAALQEVITGLAGKRAARIGFVFGNDESPTRSRLISRLADTYANARFFRYEALEGNSSAALGAGVRAVPNFANADRILSLDCDFAGVDPQGPVTAFFDRRKPEGSHYENAPDAASLNRLYCVESAFSLTGGMADHRLRVKPSEVLAVAAQLARAVGAGGDLALQVPSLTDDLQIKWVSALAADLRASGARAVVLAGSRQPAAVHHLAFAINQALGNAGADGTLSYYQTTSEDLAQIEIGGIAEFVEAARGGQFDAVVLMTPSNPVFDALPDLEFSQALAQVPVSIHHGLRTDATAHAATWHLPAAHYLESWSDTRSVRGVYGVVQPMILPLYPECVSELELLTAFLAEDGSLPGADVAEDAPSPAYLAVRETFAAIGGDSDEAWKSLLRDGFYAESGFSAATPAVAATAAADIKAAAESAAAGGIEVIFATDASVYDGRWIDNGWLQEAPDPVSKLSWDNAALIAPKTAQKLGIYEEIVALENWRAAGSPDKEGENRRSPVIRLDVNGKTLEIAVLVSFGQAEDTIVIPVGYGQGYDHADPLNRPTAGAAHVGLVGINTGFNVYPLRTAASPYFAAGAKVALADKRYPVALVQEHFSMYGRALAREISTDTDPLKGDFASQLEDVHLQGMDSHVPPGLSLYKTNDRKGQPLINDPLHQWGMSIDLSSCMGCNACLVACQAENNIPIVGKEQVAKGREMHWIRMDRYYASQEYALDEHGHKIKEDGKYVLNPEWVRDNPAFVPQPVACMQCEQAPCETVCPVNATVHTEDGLNAMAYNRCIGTRYCANNCPYKARRFNFFDYNKRNPLIDHNLYRGPLGEKQVGDSKHLQRNPNVTVRMRGVMEKCTYCVQRLKDAVIRQKRAPKHETLLADTPSPGMEVTTAMLRIPVDSVRTACQEACPANAISFGNLLDGERSAMGRSKKIQRNYDLLYYLDIRPRTSYLARVKNPNPAMPDAKYIGKATVHMV